MSKQIKTASEVIDLLGGPTAVGRITGDRPGTVWNWRERGFPPETFIVLKHALIERGVDAPASLWGMREAVAS